VSFGPTELLIVLPIFFVIPALCVWAAIDAGSKPDWAFTQPFLGSAFTSYMKQKHYQGFG
jgi:hypothetical protein